MEIVEHEVYYHEYCKACKHEEKREDEEPCYECLNSPYNLHTHRPLFWEKGAEK